MSYRMKKIAALLGCALLTISISACSLSGKKDNGDSQTPNASNISTADLFSDRDMEIGYDEESAVFITLSDTGSTATSSDVTISDSTITITKEGTYVLSGSLKNGQIIVNADSSSKIQLVLDNAEISHDSSAAIYVKQADKVFITTTANSSNQLATTGEFQADGETNVDGVIFSKDDITLNGAGQLTISTEYGHGIVSKDELTITSGTYDITASSHALSGKDCVCIADGNFTLTAGKDGIHSENTEDTEKGYIYIGNGNIEITCDGDGIDSSQTLQIENGNINIVSGGGAANAEAHIEQMGRFPMQETTESETEDTISAKGLKSDTLIVISKGYLNMDCADDAIHSNGNVEIAGGTYQIKSGDDGIHGDGDLSISSGEITVTESYEGLEAMNIAISGGTIHLTASDDGLNAAGGNDSSGFGGKWGNDMFASDENCSITISGGILYVNAEGDGIDSNGNLTISDGETYVSGPTNSGNGALDYAGSCNVSGGTLVAVGMSGMAQGVSESSTQGSIFYTLSETQSAGSIVLKDSSGNELVSFENGKQYNSVVISTDGIQEGNTYTLVTSGSENTIEMESNSYSNSNGNGMGGGFQNPGNGGGNVQKPEMNEDGAMEAPNMPEMNEDGTMPQKPEMNEDGAMEAPERPGRGNNGEFQAPQENNTNQQIPENEA